MPSFLPFSFSFIHSFFEVLNKNHQFIYAQVFFFLTGRKFTPSNYYRRLPNGEEVRRRWLFYSDIGDCVYCYACKLFSQKKISSLGNTGYCNWKHIGETLQSHESSVDHITCITKWYEASLRLKTNSCIDALSQLQIESEVEHWRSVLRRLLSIIQFLGERNLALRGSVEQIGSIHNGNFLGQVELMAMYDKVMKDHLDRIQSKETYPHYLSKVIQNEFIELIGSKIVTEILRICKAAKYYSIILDATPDISHQDQLTMILRFVNIDRGTPCIEEHFLGYIAIDDSTGLGLTEVFLQKMRELNLSLDDCRGQGYDNGSNMRGKHVGMQKRILDMNPKAIYIPCGCHSLNLVLCDAAKSSVVASTYFGNLQRLYRLFASSTKRWTILASRVTHTLKRPSETRWESRIDSVKTVRFEGPGVCAAVHDLIHMPSIDSATLAEAKGLFTEIHSFQFIVSTVIWYDVLSQVNKVSKIMQSVDMQLSTATELLQSTNNYMMEYRQQGFDRAVASAEQLAATYNEPVCPEFPEKRSRKKKRLFDYEGQDDEGHETARDKFRVDFFHSMMDITIEKLEERFEQMKDFSSKFSFLYNMNTLKALTRDELEIFVNDLSDYLEGDVDRCDLLQEILCFRGVYYTSIDKDKDTQANAINALLYIYKNNLQEIYPNLSISFRIILTVPVTVASGERSFSKLKLIKTYLRSTMSQERLNGQAIISIEHKIGRSVDYEEIIDKFANAKARKVKLNM